MNFSGSNFQSWPEFDLSITGLTVVIGPSNLGKSSLFRALKGVLRNELGASYVRNGQKKPLELTLKQENHIVIASRSREGSSQYTINDEKFSKLAGAIPDEIKKLGFGEIRIGDFTVDPIFAVQNEPQFLLDKKTYGPSLLNAILGAFGGTEKLESGKKEANLRVTQKNSEARTLSLEIAETHRRCEFLENITKQSVQYVNEIHALELSARRLEAGVARLEEADHHLTRIAPMKEILRFLDIPNTSDVESQQRRLINLNLVKSSRDRIDELAVCENSISDINAGWSEAVVLFRKSKALQETSSLVCIPKIDANELNTVIEQMATIHSGVVRLQASIRDIEQVELLRLRVEELQHERLHVEAEQNEATKLKCPKCGEEF